MATTLITIEFIDTINIKVTINGQSFQGLYGKPLRDQAAIKAIEQAHFDEIFDVRVVSKGDPDREQAELKKFKKALQNKISASYNAQNYLNLMIKREPAEADYEYYTDVRKSLLDHSKETQLNILKEAKIMADQKATGGKISEKDRIKAAKHSSPLELLKAKTSIEEQGPIIITAAQREKKSNLNETLAIGAYLLFLGLCTAPLIPVALKVGPLLLFLPGGFLLAGATFLIAAAIYSRNMEDTSPPLQLLNKLKRLDPDFLDQLEAELPIGPEPDVVIVPDIKVPIEPLPPQPAAAAANPEVGPEADPEVKNRPKA